LTAAVRVTTAPAATDAVAEPAAVTASVVVVGEELAQQGCATLKNPSSKEKPRETNRAMPTFIRPSPRGYFRIPGSIQAKRIPG
jgi:hypothetical protein